jgi:hypothetical protein
LLQQPLFLVVLLLLVLLLLLLPCHPCVPMQGVDEPARIEIEQQKYLSALPFLPAISEKTLQTYYTFYAAFFGAVILFGGLLAPLLEVKIGLGGMLFLLVGALLCSC